MLSFGKRPVRVRIRRRLRAAWLAAGFAGLMAGPVFAAAPAKADAHAASAKEEHAEHAEGGHALGEVNWAYGFLGEDSEIEAPNFLWRKPGMPVPLGAYLFNSAILFGLFYRFGKGPVIEGLKQRRQKIMRGIEDASRMKEEAAKQLAHYEAKLAGIDAEITRIRKDMQESAETERKRVLAETTKRCARMETEAQALIVQELKAARESLHGEVVNAAVRGAERVLSESVTAADHERLSDEYLGSLGAALGTSLSARGAAGGGE